MSSIDPGKLKVVELRAELTNRGLDSKGNKPVLVKRLKEALEKELQSEIPDTSIADTSTEDVNTSQDESIADDVSAPSNKDEENPPSPAEEEAPKKTKKVEVEEPVPKQPPSPEPAAAEAPESDAQDDKAEVEEQNEPEQKTEPETTVVSENGDDADHEMQEDAKSDKGEAMETVAGEEPPKAVSDEPKGEKRRRSSPSPERVQRRRSKSPIKEDEPALDNNKVQLSWYDSDLHLQVDKKSFLSGKPYHEGAFGYAWAGVRATHGAKSGKVCFEVKITEELKWDDLVKQSDKKRDGHKRDKQRSEKDSSKGDRESSKAEHGSAKTEVDEEKKAAEKEAAEETDAKNEDSEQGKDEEKKAKKEPEDAKQEEESPEVKEGAGEAKQEAEEAKQEAEEAKQEAGEAKQEAEEAKQEAGEAKQEAEEAKQEAGEAKQESETKQEPMEVDETPAEPIAKHLFRVGWSTVDSALQLGEGDYSYGYESSGKFVSDKSFVDYGAKFGVGDVIGAYMDIGDDTVAFTFTVNGEAQPQATSIPRADLPQEDFALFPHVLTRNYSFELNLGSREEPWFPHPASLAAYAYLETVEDKVQGPSRPETRAECEVVMMCGLPASGKTHWVRQLVKDNPDKRYTVIGNSHLLEKMTVNGNPLKSSYKGRWNVILDRLMKCVNVLVEAAALRRRNFVIDQTNVFPSAQRRKMRLFEGFKRRAVVVVVGDEEQAKRRAQQETQDGKDVPDSAILEMKANMSLPKRGDWLEDVSYVELPEEEAKALIQKYNQQGREAGFGPLSGQRGGYRDNRGHPYRWDHSTSRRDYRGGYRDNRSYQNQRYDRSRQGGSWQNRRPPPGSWNRDVRRENRGPSSGSRDFRNNNRSSAGSGGRPDRSSNRDNRNRSQSSGNFNRNQRSQNNRQPANWQGSSSWQSGNQGNWGGQGVWNQGNWGGQGGWSGGGGQAQQWKGNYSQGGYGQGGYGNYANWNYYSQYPQSWNSQGQPQTTTAGGTAASDNTTVAYGQYSQQAAWAQYAQQYAQGQASATQQPSTQK